MGKRIDILIGFLAVIGILVVAYMIQAVFVIFGSLDVNETRDREYKDYYDKTFR